MNDRIASVRVDELENKTKKKKSDVKIMPTIIIGASSGNVADLFHSFILTDHVEAKKSMMDNNYEGKITTRYLYLCGDLRRPTLPDLL